MAVVLGPLSIHHRTRCLYLPFVEKLHYLKACLKEEAELLIRSIPTTAENYTRAWTMLKDHFENKRLLVRTYLSQFIALQRLKGEFAPELRKLYHSVKSTVGGALESIGRPITRAEDRPPDGRDSRLTPRVESMPSAPAWSLRRIPSCWSSWSAACAPWNLYSPPKSKRSPRHRVLSPPSRRARCTRVNKTAIEGAARSAIWITTSCGAMRTRRRQPRSGRSTWRLRTCASIAWAITQ